MILRLFSIILLVIGVLSGCADSEIVLLTDQYWDELVLSSDGFKSGINNAALGSNTSIKIKLIHIDDQIIDLTDILKDITASVIILSPIFAYQAELLFEKYPDKQFVRFYPSIINTPGIITLYSEKSAIYKQAGVLCAQFLKNKLTETELPESEKADYFAGAVFYSGTERARKEIEAFSGGFSEVMDKSYLLIKRISSLDDRRGAQRAFNELRTENIRILMLSASGLNSYCLELFSIGEWKIITTNWRESGAEDDKILFSIEEDIETVLKTLFINLEQERYESIPVPSYLYMVSDTLN